MERYHTPVLLQEVLQYLDVKPERKYIDATLGGGGYAKRIIELGGVVLGIDVDEEAIEHVQNELRVRNEELRIDERLVLVRGNFRNIDALAHLHNFQRVSGIVFDLGVSSHQLEEKERGFSFQREGPLDMRMDKSTMVTAKDLVNGLSEKELTQLFWKLGEENRARSIARAIVAFRKKTVIDTTKQLQGIVRNVYKGIPLRIDPATKVFQALRMVVNDELGALEEGLDKAFSLLENGGRLVVVSFHSLEDRIVKHSFLEFEKNHFGSILTKDPIRPSTQEVLENQRSRSAKLRAFEKKSKEA